MAKEEAYIRYIYDIISKEKIKTANAAFKYHESDQNRPKPSVKLTQFKNYFKLANELHMEEVRAEESERQKLRSEARKNEIQDQILTEIEIDLILSKIAKGEIEDSSVADRISASDKLYKRKGSYAPTKLANTTASGDDKESQQGIVLPNGATITIN